MCAIAERAGLPTGSRCNRFSGKEQMFTELVGEGAEKLRSYFISVQDEFAAFPPERQMREMHGYVDGKTERKIAIICEYFDSFRLIVGKSGGSRGALRGRRPGNDHRMRTVAGADRLVLLKDGVVAEQGSPRELAGKKGLYAKMLALQEQSGEWELGGGV